MTATAGELCDLAATVAREAGRLLLDREGALDVDTKTTSTDVVTDKDRAAERLIRRRLLEARPGDAILGEEGGATGATDAAVRWIVDPIDGTVNYLYGIPQFAVSIAAEVQGQVVAGVVWRPISGTLYAATLGGGATCDGRPLACNDVTELGQALIGTGFSYSAHRRAAQARVLLDLLPAVRDIRRLGSSSLDMCAVASGRFDGYFEKGVSLWDIAAGALVAREAGAVVHVADDAHWVVAAAPGVYEALQQVLTATGASDV